MAVELATAYISLTVETGKVKEQVKTALKDAGSDAKSAGTKMGSDLAEGLRNKLSDKSWVKNALASATDNQGNVAAQKFFTEFRSTSERVGAATGLVIGKTVGAGIRGGLAVGNALDGVFDKMRSSGVAMARNVGSMIGNSLSMALKGAVGALGLGGTGIIADVLFKGFDRLKNIDTAKFKLESLGHSAAETAKIMDNALAAVKGTAFSLDQAANAAASAVAAGIEPGKELQSYLSQIGDAAAIANTSFDEMAHIFNKVQTQNKAYTDDLNMLADRGIPIFQYLQQEYGVTADQLTKMVQSGQIDAAHFGEALSTHIGGSAQKMGQSFTGAVQNMQAAMARLGANFITAVLGGGGGSSDPMTNAAQAIGRITTKFDEMGAWVNSHRTEIHDFFIRAKDIVMELARQLGNVLNFLKEHPGAIQAVATAFLAWEGLKGVATLATAIGAINTALGTTAGLATAAYAPLAAIAGIAAGGFIGGSAFSGLMDSLGGTSTPAGRNALNQEFSPGFGIPGAVSAFPATGPSIPGGGGPNAERERKGKPAAPGLFGSAFAPAGMQTGGGGGAEGWRPSVRAAIAQYGPGLGIQNTQAWENALVRQIATESGGNPGADNPTDSNGRGGQQHVSGLLQFLPSTFASHNISGGGYMDPNAQIAAALSYVMNRYGVDSSGAPLQIGRGVGYDTGGYLPPGSTTVNNQTGKPELVLNPDQQKQLAEQGVDPAALLDPGAPGADPNAHGLTNGAAPGPQAAETVSSNRTGGFIPTAASNTGIAGTSALAGYLNLGNEAIGGLIDTGASLAQTGASLALAGVSGGAGAAANGAASYGIQLAAQTAKRAVSYGFQAASIGADALIAQLFPFGAPRWIGYDYTNFMPKLGISQAATTTLEKAGNAALQQHFGVDANGNKIGQPGGPVNPSTMAGAQAPIQAPDQINPGVSAPSMTPAMDSTPGGPNSQAGSMAPDWMQRLGVYDDGGVLDPGQLAVNASRVPEQILTKQQWDSMSKLSVNDRNAPLVKIDAIYGMSPEDVSNQIASKQRLAMMRYAGRP